MEEQTAPTSEKNFVEDMLQKSSEKRTALYKAEFALKVLSVSYPSVGGGSIISPALKEKAEKVALDYLGG